MWELPVTILLWIAALIGGIGVLIFLIAAAAAVVDAVREARERKARSSLDSYMRRMDDRWRTNGAAR